MQSPAATAAELPPELPPGTRELSHGLTVFLNAERSVDEPMPNSSQLTLPMITAPAARSRSTTVASYGGCQPARIFDPAVVVRPLVTIMSFSAIGTPASGPSGSPALCLRSTSAASRSEPWLSVARYASSERSTFAIREIIAFTI